MINIKDLDRNDPLVKEHLSLQGRIDTFTIVANKDDTVAQLKEALVARFQGLYPESL